MKTLDDKFCGYKNGYSRSITLRNALIPVGKTEENIKRLNLLENDFKRANAYGEIKKFIDDFHRSFIEETFSKSAFEWKPLYDQFELFQKETDRQKKDKHKKELETLQAAMRKQIAKKFTSDERFKKLFAKELLSELLPEVIKADTSGDISDKENALKVFDKFSTYFTGFHENRKNIYSDEAKATAISNRIVNENFPKFVANVQLFKKLEKDFPQIIHDTEKSLAGHLQGKTLADIFSAEGFNAVLAQSGIDFYNTVIGGIAGEAGTEKTKGLNEHINLARQQLSDDQKKALSGKMTVLYKQILSDRETASFIPEGFETSEQVYETVRLFKENTLDKAIAGIQELFSQVNDFDLARIYVPAKENTKFAQSMFGHWSVLREGSVALEKARIARELSSKAEEKLIKEIEKRDCSLAELQKSYEAYCKANDKTEQISVDDFFRFKGITDGEVHDCTFFDAINGSYSGIGFSERKDLQQDEEAASPIKDFLDSAQNLYHYLKLVDYNGEEQKDSAFYAKYDEILADLGAIVPLYNKTRNFITKKPGEVKKIKLNFDCPTLANGWDENKEQSNDAILLLKDGRYFLGIFNPKDKPKFGKEDSADENCYRKVVYKLLPGPNKMLPKVFFSEKGKAEFNPPQEILNGYEEGKHKKGDTFDKDFMHTLIDWFKDAISRHGDWRKFGFAFSPTKTYADMSGFYKEVEAQGYKISFQNVPAEKIDSLVESGSLFLFQIYNKDFAEKADGKKNLHTLYFENIFSEENLNDVVIKLNGEAELFFRPANDRLKIHTHKKDSVLVNRTAKDGSTIPEDVYQEIYQFKNGMISSISEEAKRLLDSGNVVCKKATHDITKDRHFTRNMYLFHCPITINFKAPEITGRKFNVRVLEFLKDNPDIKIIGLDRGERHLIYLSLINQNGEIEMQKTLNVVEQARNDKTVRVDYQEKLVQKEAARDKARKNWRAIGNIKDLKEGYLSNVVHEIAVMMVEHNAIVVMEDLNFGFKRGRFAVERQVYQKFEQMLIDKLNYLVFKDRLPNEPGGVLNGYQLTDKFTSFKDLGKQCGWLFYIPAGYTSKIDPKTGFANLFITRGLTNVEKKKEFFDKFDSIRYDGETDGFVFTFDYDNFGASAWHDKDFRKTWEVNTRGERIVYSKAERKSVTVKPTEDLKKIFAEFGIRWESGENFIDSVQEIQAEKQNARFFDTLLRSLNAMLQMRNSVPNSDIDYLVSPVRAADGTFFDSREQKEFGKSAKLPIDADANGAYHIALKGLYLLRNNFNLNDKGYIESIKDADWFRFAQEKPYAT